MASDNAHLDHHGGAYGHRSLPEVTTALLSMAGIDPGPAGDVAFTGPETVLPSSFRVTEASQALVAALSVAVVQVRRLRCPGSEQGPLIVVDSLGCGASFQSERHLRLQAPIRLWDGLAGYYETNDGHIQFHTNFAHHRHAMLEAVGCSAEAEREAVAAVVSRFDRFTLERRIADAGGIAAALRSAREWRRHPHHAHVAGRSPLAVSQRVTGRAKPLGKTCPERPLARIRVLDFTRVIAGPVCTRTLAAYGADVLRIGAPDLPVVTSILPDTTLGKRFADSDITTSGGRDTVLRLVEQADVVVDGFRPGALAGRGLGPDQLFEANPDLVLAGLNAFGTDGPWGGKRGFDSITQTATGVVATETAAFGSDGPRPLPCQLLDHGTGFLLSLGILGALVARARSGGGYSVDASLLTTRNWLETLGPADPEQGHLLDDADVAPFMQTRQSDFGPMRHVRHPGSIEGVTAHWDRGPAMPGNDAAAWEPREESS